jgi:hypothetical protein
MHMSLIHVVIVVVSNSSFSYCYSYDWIDHHNSERNDIIETSARGNSGRGGGRGGGPHNLSRGSMLPRSDNGSGGGHRAAQALPFDNKYGVDLRLCK